MHRLRTLTDRIRRLSLRRKFAAGIVGGTLMLAALGGAVAIHADIVPVPGMERTDGETADGPDAQGSPAESDGEATDGSATAATGIRSMARHVRTWGSEYHQGM